jgi:hypothetical protein
VAEDIRIKGLAFLGVVRALETLKGLPFRDRVMEELAGEGGEALRTGSVIASGWYPCAWYKDLLGAADRNAESAGFIREVGRTSTRESVSVVHRIFMRMLSPETLIKQGARVFSSFYTAVLRVEVIGKGNAQVFWSGCHGFDRNCWLDQVGAVDELVALSGARLPRVRQLSGGNSGDHEMIVECQWRQN